MGLDQYGMVRNKEIDFKKVYSDNYNPVENGLGFNGEDHKVIITEDVLKRLEEAIKSDYFDYFATDGFFWGQQFQEEQVKEYKKQDKQFLKFCKEQLKKGAIIEYSCSW